MTIRHIIISLFIFLVTALPALAQNDCPAAFKAELSSIPYVKDVVQNDNGFLVILNSSDKTDSTKTATTINKIRKSQDAGSCDFSGIAVAIMDSDLNTIKTTSDSALSNKDITDLLYKHVYKISPVDVEENLNGYKKLHERSPQNSYYKSRVEHYAERVNLIEDRNKFITIALEEVAKDRNILDLKIKKDFYLFIVDSENPLNTANDFLSKIGKHTPRPDKKICIFAYNAELDKRESDCPAEYMESSAGNEEELLMRHVQAIPSSEIQKNINGYKALKDINPNTTLYTTKLSAYEFKMQGLNRFLNLRTASGEKLISRSTIDDAKIFATLDASALSGKSESAKQNLLKFLASYYDNNGRAYPNCVLKAPGGETLGTISCGKNGCTLR